jgi:tetratricopeptide (TPR) repeat protein
MKKNSSNYVFLILILLFNIKVFSQEIKDTINNVVSKDTLKQAVFDSTSLNKVQPSLTLESKPLYNPKLNNYKINRLYVKANKNYENKKYESALNDLNAAIQSQPPDSLMLPVLYLLRANIRVKEGNAGAALEDYNNAIQLNSGFSIAYSNRGVAKHMLGNDSAAIADYTKAISINNSYAEAYYNRGISYFALKNYDKAIFDFTKALKFKEAYIEALNNRAVARFHSGDIAGACDDLNKAVGLGDSDAIELINEQCK